MIIGKEFIGAVIGPGGKIIQGIQEKTGATVSIDEVDGVGKIEISGTNKATIDAAVKAIKGIVAVPEIGEVYEGKISSIMPYGAFVEFMPGKDGLLHISEIDWKRLETVEQAGLKEGVRFLSSWLISIRRQASSNFPARYCFRNRKVTRNVHQDQKEVSVDLVQTVETVVLVKIVVIADLAGSTETKIRSYTLYIIPGRLNAIRDFFIKSSTTPTTIAISNWS